MIILTFAVSIILNVLYVLIGHFKEALKAEKNYKAMGLVLRVLDVFVIFFVSFLLTDTIKDLMFVAIYLFIIYLAYFVSRGEKKTWLFYVVLFLSPFLAVLAMGELYSYTADNTFFYVLCISILSIKEDFFKQRNYKWYHYVTLITGAVCGFLLFFLIGM